MTGFFGFTVLLLVATHFLACAPLRTSRQASGPQQTAADSIFVDPSTSREFEDGLLRARWHLFRALDERTVGRFSQAQLELDEAFRQLAWLEDSPYLDLVGDAAALGGDTAAGQGDVDQLGDAVEQVYLSLLPNIEHSSPDSPLSLLLKGLSEAEIESLPTDASQIVRIHQLAPLCDIPIDANPAVAASIRFFQTKGRETYSTWRRRSGRYRDLILPILRAEGLPQDLFYLAMIESGFNPRAYSRAHAAGMWQFISATARREGLRVDRVVDERRNPLKATHAAARHLKSLHQDFGDWRLAVAAYNSGRGRVQRAIDKAQSRDVWRLELPRETRNYVPLLMAATVIAKDPEQFGFGDVDHEAPIRYDDVDLPVHVNERPFTVDLKAAAKMMGIAYDELRQLNLELRLGFTPPRRKQSYELLVPLGHGADFVKRYAALPESKKPTLHRYRVRRGDSISTIARTFGVSTSLVAQVNNLRDPNLIHPGRTLFVPALGSGAGSAALSTGSSGEQLYTVRKGDSLSGIALLFGVQTELLKQWNSLTSDLIHPGQKLAVRLADSASVLRTANRAPRTAPRTEVEVGRHTVRRGETLWSLSRRFGVKVADLLTWNRLGGELIHPGQQLIVAEARRDPFKLYMVVNGDTLYGIARRFGLDAREIARQNNMSLSSTLLAGMTLRIKNVAAD